MNLKSETGTSWFFDPSRPLPLLTVVIALGIAVRLLYLFTSSLWFDEAASVYYANQSVPTILQMLRLDVGEPLYLFALRAWISVFGDGELGSASLSTFLSVLNIIVIYFLAKKVSNNRAALLSVIILAFNHEALHNSTNIRFYALLNFVVLLSYLTFFYSHTNKKHEITYVIVALLGMHTHTYFVFVLFAQGMLVIIFYRHLLKRFLVLYTIAGVLYMPWFLLMLLHQVRNMGSTGMPPIENGVFGAVFQFGQSMWLMLVGVPFVLTIGPVIGLLAFFGTLGWAIANRRSAEDEESLQRPTLVMLTAFGLSVGTPILISLVKPIFLLGRYDVIGLGVLVIAVSMMLSKMIRLLPTRVGHPMGFIVVFVACFVLMIPGTKLGVMNPADGDRQAARWASEQISSESTILFTGVGFLTPRYYLEKNDNLPEKQHFFPEDVSYDSPIIWIGSYERDARALNAYADVLIAEIAQDDFDVLCVFYDEANGLTLPIKSRLDERFTLVEEFDVFKHPWGPLYDKVLIYEK